MPAVPGLRMRTSSATAGPRTPAAESAIFPGAAGGTRQELPGGARRAVAESAANASARKRT
jgi:hypothetical protein